MSICQVMVRYNQALYGCAEVKPAQQFFLACLILTCWCAFCYLPLRQFKTDISLASMAHQQGIEFVAFMNLQLVCLDFKTDRTISCTSVSGHALPFHFLLNSLVNADVCFVKAFLKALAGPYESRGALWKLSIMDDHSRVQTFALRSQGVC